MAVEMNQRIANRKLEQREPNWAQWLMLVALAFIAAESAVLAVVMKGVWLVLLAPAVACAMQALQTWRELQQNLSQHGNDAARQRM